MVPAAAAGAAFAGGVALGTAAEPLPLALLPFVAGAALTAALLRPRWSLVVTLGLLVGYVPEAAGFSLAAHALTGTLIAAVLIRRAVGAERFDVPPTAGILVALVLAYALSSSSRPTPASRRPRRSTWRHSRRWSCCSRRCSTRRPGSPVQHGQL